MINELDYENLNYEKILGVYFFDIKDKNNIQKLFLIIKVFIISLLRKYKSTNGKNYDVEFLFLKTQNRKDYNELFGEICDQCTHGKAILDISFKYGINTSFLSQLFFRKKILSYLMKNHKLLDCIYMYVMFIRSFIIFSCLKSFDFNNLVVFSDVQPLENLLVQYSNTKKINTITLQHGLYIDYNKLPNINMLNYLDVQSNYLLAWGKSTEDLFKKYNSNIDIHICGKPVELRQKKIERNKKLIAVVCDQPMFRKDNKKILKIAYEIAFKKNMKVIIRLHPQDEQKYYDYDETLTEFDSDINNAYYILAHTTSMIYEYLALGYKVFKLRSSIPANEISELVKFGSTEELENKLEINFDFHKESKRYIKYVGEESKLKYKEFFDNIHEEQKSNKIRSLN